MVTVEAMMPKKMKNWTRIPSFTGRVCMIAGEFIESNCYNQSRIVLKSFSVIHLVLKKQENKIKWCYLVHSDLVSWFLQLRQIHVAKLRSMFQSHTQLRRGIGERLSSCHESQASIRKRRDNNLNVFVMIFNLRQNFLNFIRFMVICCETSVTHSTPKRTWFGAAKPFLRILYGATFALWTL